MLSLITFALIGVVFGQLDAFSTTQTGDGTFYGGNDQGGNCAIWPLPSFANGIKHVAMNQLQYVSGDQSRGCGMCVSISGIPGQSGSVVAFVNDRCPECAKGAIDLGWSGDGRFPISWKAIDCPVQGNLQYIFQGSNNFYMKLQVRNHRIPVQSLEFQTPSGSWIKGSRTQDNFFLATGYPFPVQFPLNVRVTGINGNAVVDKISSLSSSVFNGGNGVQLSGISGGGSTTPKPVAQPPAPKAVPKAPVPVPKAAPQAPKPVPKPVPAPKSAPQASSSSCSALKWGSATQDWWVEIEGPAGLTVAAQCSSGRLVNCVAKWGKYVCDPSGTACTAPRKISCKSSARVEGEDDSPSSSHLPVGAIVGIVLGSILVVALIIGAVVLLRSKPTSETV